MKLITKLVLAFSALVAGLAGVAAIVLSIYLQNHFQDQTLKYLYSIVESANVAYEGLNEVMETRMIDWASDGYIRETTEKLLAAAAKSIELTFLVTAILIVVAVGPAYFISRFMARQLS